MANITQDTFVEAGPGNINLTSHTATPGGTDTYTIAVGTEGFVIVSSSDNLHPQGSFCVYYSSATPSSADYQVTADLTFVSASSQDQDAGLLVRQSASAVNTNYLLRRTGGAGTWDYYRLNSGSGSLLGSYTQTLSDATTYAMFLSAEGTGSTVTVTATIDGTHLSNSPKDDKDANRITATGRPGLWTGGGSGSQKNTLDNYSADDIAAGGDSGAPFLKNKYRLIHNLVR